MQARVCIGESLLMGSCLIIMLLLRISPSIWKRLVSHAKSPFGTLSGAFMRFISNLCDDVIQMCDWSLWGGLASTWSWQPPFCMKYEFQGITYRHLRSYVYMVTFISSIFCLIQTCLSAATSRLLSLHNCNPTSLLSRRYMIYLDLLPALQIDSGGCGK